MFPRKIFLVSNNQSRPTGLIGSVIHVYGVFQVNLFYSTPRVATVRARTHCDLVLLYKKDLDQLIVHYPQGIQKGCLMKIIVLSESLYKLSLSSVDICRVRNGVIF